MTIATAKMLLEDILADRSARPKRPRIAELIGEVTLDRSLGEASAQALLQEYEIRIEAARP